MKASSWLLRFFSRWRGALTLYTILAISLTYSFRGDLALLLIEHGSPKLQRRTFHCLSKLETPDSLDALLQLSLKKDCALGGEAEKVAWELALERLDPDDSLEVYFDSLEDLPEKERASRFGKLEYLLYRYRQKKRVLKDFGGLARDRLATWTPLLRRSERGRGWSNPYLILMSVACADLEKRGFKTDFIINHHRRRVFFHIRPPESPEERVKLAYELEQGSENLKEILRSWEEEEDLLSLIPPKAWALAGDEGLRWAREHYRSSNKELKTAFLGMFHIRSELHHRLPGRCLSTDQCSFCSLYKEWISIEVEDELLWGLASLSLDDTCWTKLSSWTKDSRKQSADRISQETLIYYLAASNQLWNGSKILFDEVEASKRPKVILSILNVLPRYPRYYSASEDLSRLHQELARRDIRFDPSDLQSLLKHKNPRPRAYAVCLGLGRLRESPDKEAMAQFLGDGLALAPSIFSELDDNKVDDMLEFLQEIQFIGKKEKKALPRELAKGIVERIGQDPPEGPILRSEGALKARIFIRNALGDELLKAIEEHGKEAIPEFIHWLTGKD